MFFTLKEIDKKGEPIGEKPGISSVENTIKHVRWLCNPASLRVDD
jgi:hypothetical protein